MGCCLGCFLQAQVTQKKTEGEGRLDRDSNQFDNLEPCGASTMPRKEGYEAEACSRRNISPGKKTIGSGENAAEAAMLTTTTAVHIRPQEKCPLLRPSAPVSLQVVKKEVKLNFE